MQFLVVFWGLFYINLYFANISAKDDKKIAIQRNRLRTGIVTNCSRRPKCGAGTTLTSKSKSVVYEVKPNANPDESIRYDENNNEYVTKTWYTQGPNGIYDRRVARQDNPDGTRTVYTYNRSGDTDTTTTLSGVFSGDTLTLGARQISVSNGSGTTVSSESWFVDTANSVDVKTASTVNSNFDAFGRAQTTTYLDGSTVNRVYGCCGVESETDRDGIVTTYAYDDFKRLSYSVRDGITTLYGYNAAGNQTSVTVKGRESCFKPEKRH